MSTNNQRSAPHRVAITSSVLADDGRVMLAASDERIERRASGKKGGYGYTRGLSLAQLPTGRYVLRIEARTLLAIAVRPRAKWSSNTIRYAGRHDPRQRGRQRCCRSRRTIVATLSLVWLWAAHRTGTVTLPRGGLHTRMVAGGAFAGSGPRPAMRSKSSGRVATDPRLRSSSARSTAVRACLRADDRDAVSHRHAAALRTATCVSSTEVALPGDAIPSSLRPRVARTATCERAVLDRARSESRGGAAYLAGPFPASDPVVERANGYVRFHAWQAIIGLGGLLISCATLVFSFLSC